MPVEEVLAERARLHHLGEVPVRRRDHAHVRGARNARTQDLVDPVLQHPQELHLAARVQLADLVEEDRPAARQVEAPPAVLLRVGEGSAHVAEHLALEQGRRDPAEVHLDERAVPAPAVPVDRLGDQLLARPALSRDEHRGVGGGDAPDDSRTSGAADPTRGSSRTRSRRPGLPSSRPRHRPGRGPRDRAPSGRTGASAGWTRAW